jgi:DNA-directed RNA polymerase specialized sigma24 family protein
VTPESSSLDAVLAGLAAGDQEAARRIHERFVGALVRLAARSLPRRPGLLADPESIAQSVFLSFFTGQRRGAYQLDSWAMVYGLLAHITLTKCLSRVRAARRRKRDPGAAVVTLEDWQQAAAGPGPEDEAVLAELLDAALDGLAPDERAMIEGVLGGESPAEVALRVRRSDRTVQRAVERFQKRLRKLLDRE